VVTIRWHAWVFNDFDFTYKVNEVSQEKARGGIPGLMISPGRISTLR
jgi:hypothetical protein